MYYGAGEEIPCIILSPFSCLIVTGTVMLNLFTTVIQQTRYIRSVAMYISGECHERN